MQAPKPHDKPGSITVKHMVYYLPYKGEAIPVDHGYSQWIANQDDQPFIRTGKIGSEWEALEYCWLQEASLVVIENLEVKYLERIPELQDLVELYKRTIEVSLGNVENPTPSLLVHPNSTQPFHPANVQNIRIRCANNLSARYKITVIPK